MASIRPHHGPITGPIDDSIERARSFSLKVQTHPDGSAFLAVELHGWLLTPGGALLLATELREWAAVQESYARFIERNAEPAPPTRKT